ncbi:Elongation factor-like GTPase 1 [Orbilia oligospora]|uniref:Ribosome assembly protein 1 n=2 Tax=Orbilia oligospora TaxID=2813651 RepID=A0A7C8RHU4_ORBOL|nr:Elongation factor-like GTPase 1 [Orbilia oligospora]
MPVISSQQLIALQSDSEFVRNICILAHVDHGKTSLSDCLLSSNGIISPKLAGKVRFLDSRPDEQIRGITMESSAISLYFQSLKPPVPPSTTPSLQDYLINLIDSPGHIDFSSEVSTASRLCDGALVLVDAVEGVCSQTVTVLRQTWLEHLRPVLVINKIDRLITEWKMSPTEANVHLGKLLEQVNAVMGSFFAGERMEDDLKWREQMELRQKQRAARRESASKTAEEAEAEKLGLEDGYEEKDDEDLYFSPEKFNVIFASAIDGWAFTVKDFAAIHEKKLGVKRSVLEKILWGDFYLDPKTKRVLKKRHLKGRNLKPMFVQFALDNIWAIYDNILRKDRDQEKVEKIVQTLGIKVLPRDLKSKDSRALLSTILMQWLPLSRAVLGTVVSQLPSPPAAQKQRVTNLIENSPGGAELIAPEIKNAMENLNVNEEAIVAYVSKMISVPEKDLPRNQREKLTAEQLRELGRIKRQEMARALAAAAASETASLGGQSTADSDLEQVVLDMGNSNLETTDTDSKTAASVDPDKENLIGFARLYSGTISVGQTLHVLGPKYDPRQPDQHVSSITVTDLYLMMGRELVSLEKVPAGNVFGIGGLEGKVLKNATLCSTVTGGVNLASVASMGAAPIVRVALEPKNPGQLQQMIRGLKLLEQSDPCMEYLVQSNGEHVILTAGELHLERCLKDLRERFAKIEIEASKPIVPYRETILSVPEMPPPKNQNLPRGTVVISTPGKHVTFKLRVRPLPSKAVEYLEENVGTLKKFFAEKQTERDADDLMLLTAGADAKDCLPIEEFEKGFQAVLIAGATKDTKNVWTDVVSKISSFGPRRAGPNILIDNANILRRILRENDESETPQNDGNADEGHESASLQITIKDFRDKIITAFQNATFQGPLCNEPMQGVAVFLDEVKVEIADEEVEALRMKIGQLIGEVITGMTSAIRQGFLDWSPRLLLAMYSCEIQASSEVLGKVYGVITRRRGRIVAEEMKEGTPFYTINSLLPVVESFGFADEIRTKTSGAASPQLIFSGFENILDEDPFWVPHTEDELEDLGELADRENVAKRYMDGVRVRKGLFVAKKMLAGAEKQSTRKK